MIKKTKIVATIGPATEKDEIVQKLVLAGADIFRFNLKHNSLDWHREIINRVRKIAESLDKNVAILADAPKVELGTKIDNADFVALSYLKEEKEIEILRDNLSKLNIKSKIIAKIENGQALANLDEIVKVSDGVMVARGDLGIEVPIEELAFWQKEVVDTCRVDDKPVIVATQMLQSMVKNTTPTRAEAVDVANAVFDGTDAVMLSEETAIGEHPVEAVQEMAKIVEFCEKKSELRKVEKKVENTTEMLVRAAANIVNDLKITPVEAIVVFSQSGGTVRNLASYRLKVPVIAVTNNKDILKLLSLSFGVIPYFKEFADTEFRIDGPVFNELIETGLINRGETVLVIHGNDWITAGATSDISIKSL